MAVPLSLLYSGPIPDKKEEIFDLVPDKTSKIDTLLETICKLTNLQQFSIVYNLIDHRNNIKNVQKSETTRYSQVVSLQSFEHF